MSEYLDPRLAWLELHDPRRIERVMQSTEIVPMIATGAVPTVVPSNSIVGGTDATSALALDQQVAAARGKASAPTPQLIELFKRSPLTGCTSIMDMALTSSGWNPLDPRKAGSYAGFMNYATALGKTPFFTQPPIQTQPKLLGGSDYNAIVKQIGAVMTGLTPADTARMAKTILNMAHAVFTGGKNVTNSATATLFAQQAIGVNNGDIQINLYHCQVAMIYRQSTSKHSSSTTSQQDFTIHRFATGFKTSDWANYAEAVAKKQITVVDEWLKKTTTPS